MDKKEPSTIVFVSVFHFLSFIGIICEFLPLIVWAVTARFIYVTWGLDSFWPQLQKVFGVLVLVLISGAYAKYPVRWVSRKITERRNRQGETWHLRENEEAIMGDRDNMDVFDDPGDFGDW